MKHFSFVIIDDSESNRLKTKAVTASFQNLSFLAFATNYEDGLDCILEYRPDLVFLEIDPSDKDSNLSLMLINELHRYLKVIPKIFVTTKNDSLCLNAFKYGVFDYFIHPIESKELRKSLYRLEKEVTILDLEKAEVKTMLPKNNLQQVDAIQDISVEALVDKTLVQLDKPSNETSDTNIKTEEVITNPETSTNLSLDEANLSIINNSQLRQDSFPTEKDVSFIQTENTHEKPLIICVKSYGDYRYIEAKDICYLQADNNSTDIHLHTGEMITAFKTLKHFEGVMTYPFVRIHNSYIVNIDFVSRIHTGNTVCHIKGTTTKLPFSKSYKENIDGIISYIASGNYLEI